MCCALPTLAAVGDETPSGSRPRGREWAGGPAARRLPVNFGIVVEDNLGEGSRIIYQVTHGSGTADVVTMLPDGSSRFTLTRDPGYDGEPVWSPGGTMIAFVSDRAGSRDVHIMEPDGSNVLQVTFGASARHPRWSPRGDGIAYIDEADGRGGPLRIVDPASADTRTVGPSVVWGFTWSPDGTRISYRVRSSTGGSGDHVIGIVDEDGSNIVELDRIRPVVYPNFIALSTPIWERDMRFLRYAGLNGFGKSGIDSATGKRVSVQGDARQTSVARGIPVALSPDGTRLVSAVPSAEIGYAGYVYLVDTATSELTRPDLVRWSGDRYDWSPDGSSVVAAQWGSLFVIDAASGASQEIVYSGGSHPSWRPRPTLPPHPRPSLVIEAP
ncbi:MAG: hypothetical protein ABGY41_22385, partial [Candidatus Poribacteria bacterium]